MSSRKEQKEALRREREAREAQAKAAAQRKRLVGYAVGGGLALAAVVAIVVLILAGGGDGGASPDGGDLPSGGSVPEQKTGELRQAAQAAGCRELSYAGMSREHTQPGEQPPDYPTEPPTSGKHDPVPAEDGAYGEAPSKGQLVHALEHGRVIFWFKPSLSEDQIADLRALFDEDQYQILLAPNAEMKEQVAASAWNKDPEPNGSGKILSCPRFTPEVFDALRAFRDENRGRGPEPVP